MRLSRFVLVAQAFASAPAEPAEAPDDPIEVPPPGAVDEAPAAAPPEPPLPSCCRDYEHLKELDGQRVQIVGTYIPEKVIKRGPKGPDPDAVTVHVQSDAGFSLWLGVYHRDDGQRPEDERQRFIGKRVRVVGVVHLATPEQYSPDGHVMQSMISPYIDVESVTAAPP